MIYDYYYFDLFIMNLHTVQYIFIHSINTSLQRLINRHCDKYYFILYKLN